MGLDSMGGFKAQPVETSTTTKLARLSFLLALLVTTMAVLERVVAVMMPSHNGSAGWVACVLLLGYLVYLGAGYRLDLGGSQRNTNLSWTLLWRSLFILLILAFILVYPRADSGALGFHSDRDEAIDIGVDAIRSGLFPYDCFAQSGVHSGCPAEGNPIGPMPGAFMIAMPVILVLGSAAWLSLISLGIAYRGLEWYWGSREDAARFMVWLLVLAPVMSAEIITGGDHLANAVWVSLPLLLLIQDPGRRNAWLLALVLGVALSWRGLFWLTLVPVSCHFIGRHRWRELLGVGSWVALGFVLVTLPFLVWDLDGFTPLAIQQRYQLYEHILPYASILIPGCLFMVGSYLGWRARDTQQLALVCGWMLLLPILIAILFHSYESGRFTTIFYGWYALMSVLLLGVAATGPSPRSSIPPKICP